LDVHFRISAVMVIDDLSTFPLLYIKWKQSQNSKDECMFHWRMQLYHWFI